MGMDVLIWTFSLGNGFMFLISCGYWQELIETIVWAHERTPLANLIRWKDKPVVLSIVQARLVGLAHFTIGYHICTVCNRFHFRKIWLNSFYLYIIL
jgi:photosystem I P700 chlorophyll a apoprotein A2